MIREMWDLSRGRLGCGNVIPFFSYEHVNTPTRSSGPALHFPNDIKVDKFSVLLLTYTPTTQTNAANIEHVLGTKDGMKNVRIL